MLTLKQALRKERLEELQSALRAYDNSILEVQSLIVSLGFPTRLCVAIDEAKQGVSPLQTYLEQSIKQLELTIQSSQ